MAEPRNRVVQVRRFGGPDELEVVDAPLPTAGRGEVRVRVLASSVVYTDVVIRRHLYPQPRYRAGAAVAGLARAMIDISDGLSTDLGHILEESKVSARIYKDRLPAAAGAEDRHVLHGGEEYELIIVAPDLPASAGGVPLSRIGEIIESGPDHQVFLIDGPRESVLLPHGWQHF